MRNLCLLLLLLVLSPFCLAQGGSTTITIVAAPSLGTITPTPAHFYQNTAAPISLASSTNGFNSGCTATAGATALPVTFSSTTNALTGTLTAAMTSGAPGSTLTITLTCTPPALTLANPNPSFPNGQPGVAYSISTSTLTGLSGGVPPYSFSLTSGSFPPGLTLSSSSGVLSGVVSSTAAPGSYSFTVTVSDSTVLSQRFVPRRLASA